MGFNPFHLPCVMYTPAARVPSHYRRPFTVSTFPFTLRYIICTYDRLTLPYLQQQPDAHNVCMRAKNHYDPRQGQQLFGSEILTEASNQAGAGIPAAEFALGFRPTHERMAKTMYFC